MRFLILLLAVFLVSCATPKTAPQSYYSGVYAPGNVEISSDGNFISKSAVYSAEDFEIARKAAFARLMLDAKNLGYQYFEIDKESSSKFLGLQFKVTGKVFKQARIAGGIFPIDAIKRLLRDLPLAAPQPVYHSPKAGSAKKMSKIPAQTRVSAPPAIAPSKPASGDGDPLVIMAPEDITGSIKRANSRSSSGNFAPANSNTGPSAMINTDTGIAQFEQTVSPVPESLSNTPKGVLFRTN